MSFRDTIILAMSEEMCRDRKCIIDGEDVGVFGGRPWTSGMLEDSVQNVSDLFQKRAIAVQQLVLLWQGAGPITGPHGFQKLPWDAIVNQAAKTRYMLGGKGYRYRRAVALELICSSTLPILESWFTHSWFESCCSWNPSGYEGPCLLLFATAIPLSFSNINQNSTKREASWLQTTIPLGRRNQTWRNPTSLS